MAIRFWSTVAICASALLAQPAPAAGGKAPRPEVFQKLVDCRAVTDSVARLACYDTQVAKLDEAETRHDLVVVDKEEVKKARKGLFGLSLPDLGGLFGKGEDGEDPALGLVEINSTIKSATLNKSGKWAFTIEDGARWVQTDLVSIRDPKPGQPVKIRKGALGSFIANINEHTGFKVIRLN